LVRNNIQFQNIDGGLWKQGWPVTYDTAEWSQQDPLRVFVMPHSHVDAGWLLTFDEYYTQQTRGIMSVILLLLTWLFDALLIRVVNIHMYWYY
jgi:alpha-mannosidase II